MHFNISRLNLEFITWGLDNDTGRNKDDLRFGQFLHNKYQLEGFTDVFHIENAQEAYNILLKDLLVNNEERAQQNG